MSLLTYRTVLYISIIISFVHLIVDCVKKHFKNKFESYEFAVYFIEQVLHIFLIVVITYCCADEASLEFNPVIANFLAYFSSDILRLTEKLLAILILLKPADITIALLLESFDFKKDNPKAAEVKENNEDEGLENSKVAEVKGNNKDDGLENAGSTIGKLERLVTYILASAGQFEAIGFILTAKSITRYEKIASSEYYLIGTLASFLCAILMAVLF